MIQARRIIKRLFIIVIYLILITLMVFGFYYLSKPKPTCNDGVRNQSEEKIDCGGPCPSCLEIPNIENLRVLEKEIMPAGENKVDVLAKLENPNSQFGAAGFDYTFSILGKSGEVVSEKKGTSFVLPGQRKYIFAFGLESSEEPSSLNFRISSFKWTRFAEYQEPDINIYSKEFNLVSGGAGFAQLKGKMRNQSGYDFKNITVKAVLRNGESAPAAINETSFNDVRVGEEREIFLNWPNPFTVDPASVKIEVESEVDVFSSDNFMRKFGTPGQYDSYNAGQL